MKQKYFVFFAGLLVVATGVPCAAADLPTTCDDDSSAAVRSELFRNSRTTNLYRATVNGDKESATDVAVEIGKTHPDYAKCINRLGAENGDPIAQYNYSIWLTESKDEATRLRGMYWLRRAATANHELAKEKLAEYRGGKRK